MPELNRLLLQFEPARRRCLKILRVFAIWLECLLCLTLMRKQF